MPSSRYLWGAACAALLTLGLTSHPAFANDAVKVAKAGDSLMFCIADIGSKAGIWNKVGIDITTIQMDGEAPMDKAMASGDIDFALAGGNSMAFRLKGVPDIAVAEMSGPPYDFVIAIAANSPIKSVADLKGKSIGITSAGSTTDFLVHELSRLQGWGPTGMTSVSLGSTRARLAALAKGDIAGMVTTPEGAFDSEEHGATTTLVYFGDPVKDFLSHTILARQDIVDKNPALVQRFLKGWFMSLAYAKDPANRDLSVKTVADLMQISPTAAAKAFEVDLKGMTADGVFDPKQVEAAAQSMPTFGILDHVPAAKDLYTDKFVPVKLGN